MGQAAQGCQGDEEILVGIGLGVGLNGAKRTVPRLACAEHSLCNKDLDPNSVQYLSYASAFTYCSRLLVFPWRS
jgi:hypothetical protein